MHAGSRWLSGSLAARGGSLTAFDGRSIPADCVAPPSHIGDILRRRALPARRLARLGATPDFHHGPLRVFVLLGAVLAFTVGFTVAPRAQAQKTTAAGVYSDAQATRGEALYTAGCSVCHGPSLEGNLAPPLTGADFLGPWNQRVLVDLVDKVQKTMPASEPGSLARGQAIDIVAYLLKKNALPAGMTDLADATLKQVTIVAPSAPAAAAAAARATGNMAELMRGIMFPSANMIFNVQSYDPAAPKAAYEPGSAGFSWVTWGGGLYSGWELVDYAGVALSESAPLLLTPRRCENGKQAPVTKPDWIAFTELMAEAGRASHRASQARDRDAVIEVTNQITEACAACHSVYRDKRTGPSTDPGDKSGRCPQ